MILKEVLEKSILFLKTKNIEPAKIDSELLISDTLNLKRLDLYLQQERPMTEAEVIQCRERVVRRGKGEPVSLILGRRDFCGFTFRVNNHVLTPRFETEELVEKAVDLFQSLQLPQNSVVLDLGAGSGCIGISFLLMLQKKQIKKKILPLGHSEKEISLKNETAAEPIQKPIDSVPVLPKILAVEKSAKAFEVLKLNAEQLLSAELKNFYFPVLGDCAEPQKNTSQLSDQDKKSIFVILGNPPYIANESKEVATDVLEHEPKEALFGGTKGTEAAQAWIQNYFPLLQKNGFFLFEMGFDQGPSMTRIFQESGLHDVQVFKDLSGQDRIIYGRK